MSSLAPSGTRTYHLAMYHASKVFLKDMKHATVAAHPGPATPAAAASQEVYMPCLMRILRSLKGLKTTGTYTATTNRDLSLTNHISACALLFSHKLCHYKRTALLLLLLLP